MIAKGKVIDSEHGAANINYLMTKEKAQILRTNMLGSLRDPDEIWMHMEMHRMNTRHLRKANHKIDKPYFEFEISPDISETIGWNLKDFGFLLDEFTDELDRIDLSELTGHKGARGFDLSKVQYVAAVHYDSKSKIPHIHLGGSRVMANGQLLDQSKLDKRIMEAVHRINLRHGWALPEDIHKQHLKYVNDACMKALERMKSFSWECYGSILGDAGLDFKPTYDKNNEIVNYSIYYGNSKFKSSILGVGRNLTVRNIKSTWMKIIYEQKKIQKIQEAMVKQAPQPKTEQKTFEVSSICEGDSVERVLPSVSSNDIDRYKTLIEIDGKKLDIDIPMGIYDYFKKNCNVPEGNTEASKDDIVKISLLLFAGIIDSATSMSESCGGGGGSCESGWGRKDDEDDEAWKRRCLKEAHNLCRPKIRYGRGL